MRIFSGAQPSGEIHLGNYLGALRNWVKLQNENDGIFCIVDLHALTEIQNSQTLKENILKTAAAYLAAGIDPKKSIVFIQSHILQHAELAWILNTIAKIPELERMTQFKDKSRERRANINVGLFDYPVLMAADILLYRTDLVPVGEDQKQHVEIARALARRFNRLYGKTFVIPKSFVQKQGAKIMGLDNPLKKMAKSASNPYNYIALLDSPEIIEDKIKKAVTDSSKEIKYDLKNKPAISNLLTIYSLVSDKSIPDLEKQYKDCQSYAQFKEDLAQAIIKFLTPFQKKYNNLIKKPDYLKALLKEGAAKAEKIASAAMKEVKQKIGLI